MELNYLAFAIPGFFLFLGLEYTIALKKNRSGIFNMDNSITNLSVGIAERLLNLFISGSFFGLFYWIYENYALFNIPNTWWVWALLILLTDLVWYWYHRLGHEINILWAAHIVHHQSEDFNYTVSARITVFQALIRNIFWCILPLLGFHPVLVITILVIHGAYSFFTHTQLIGKLGWLEHILITPSLHGIHHASDEKYLNKNYGDVFVFWDKLFGTFQKEEEKPSYGLTHPLNSHSFLWQHFHYYMEIFASCATKPGIWNKLKVVFGRPEDMDQNLRPQLEKVFLPHSKKKNDRNRRFRNYVLIQFAFVSIVLFLMTLFFKHLTVEVKIAGAVITLLTLINCGALLEQRTWLYNLEKFRLFVLLTFICQQFQSIDFFFLTTLLIFSLDLIIPVKKYYFAILNHHDQ
ncbi:MAG: sterol desaturase family protein [Pedobacter sp.]|nr:MAG: sterol desaturase family protein [Pedobacter sp.]